MKIYSAPTSIPKPALDLENFNLKRYEAAFDKYIEAIGKHMRALGYTGANTGKTIRFGVADGYAVYVVVQKPGDGGMLLVHIDLMDGWHFQYANRLTKKDVLAEIRRSDELAKLFNRKATS